MGKLPTLRRGTQNIRLISEPGLYKLAFRSNKPQADAFTNWVASEVLPAIRQTGKFEAAPQGMVELPPAAPEPALPAPVPARPRLLPVRFHDAVLYVIDHGGEPYTSLRHVAAGVGVSAHTQIKKLRAQSARWGCVLLQARDDDANPCICIPLRVLPAFLLSISPLRPETRERLALYQRECYETLLRRWEGGGAESAPPSAGDRVFPHNGRMVTTTFAVSRSFGVPHYRVIKDLGDMILENPGLASGVERRDSGDHGGAVRTEFILDKTVFLRLTRPYGMEADAAAFAEAFDDEVPAALPSPPPAVALPAPPPTAAPLPLPPAEPAGPSPKKLDIETLGLSLVEAWKAISRLMERTYSLETGRFLTGRE